MSQSRSTSGEVIVIRSTTVKMVVFIFIYLSAMLSDCSGVILECMLTHGGHEYQGALNHTRSGFPCQRWDSQTPHGHIYTNPVSYPDATISDAENYCRNPDQQWGAGTWCFINLPQYRWQSCDVPFCECKIDDRGSQYMGTLSVTTSGLTCQYWDSPTPHPHNFTNDHQFPDLDLLDAGNHCRNPDSFRPEGPWCYTTSENVEWEYCNVSMCAGYALTSSSSAPSTTVPTLTSTEAQVSLTSSSLVSTERREQSSATSEHYTTSTSHSPTDHTSTDSQPTSHYQTTITPTRRSPRPPSGLPQTTPKVKASTSSGSKISVVGIVVGVLLGVFLIVGAIGMAVWWRFFRTAPSADDKKTLDNFDNPLYDRAKSPPKPVSTHDNPTAVMSEDQT